jgi:G patch domain-containing protein 1
VADARARGESLRFNEKAVRDIEEFAPETEFAPDDIPRMFLEQNDAQHGIGYKPLEHSNVLNESFNMKVNSLKTKLKSKGIRGKAFGVGAFEDDDEDIYTVEDLSKYDYAIGGNNVEKEVERCKFLIAKTLIRYSR